MDPALQELLGGEADDEIEAIIRLDPASPPPPSVRIVSRFGEVATCRIKRGDIADAHADDAVVSLKAPRLMTPEPSASFEPDGQEPDRRRPANLHATGKGVVVAALDWGCDVAHTDFRNENGSTRLLALWDQRGSGPHSPQPYGYGRVYFPQEINRALQADDPYAALGYHPGDGDPDGQGSHGTHVLSIAAGNGRGGGPEGMAPEADLVFVHLTTRRTEGLANLGDSVTILEAIDFVDGIAGERPCVINASVGRHGGPHDGTTLCEKGFDHFVSSRPGRAIVQSCGNYYDASVHASGSLQPGEKRTLRWTVNSADTTPNELEIWYEGADTFSITVSLPESVESVRVPVGESAVIRAGGREVGRAYHRSHDPNNGRNHFDAFLDAGGPSGTWEVEIEGIDVVDGRFHAWVERDAACPGCQSHFHDNDADPGSTLGTICNALRTIAVGAVDFNAPDWPLARFSSSGPTLDGRRKPEVLAPGVRILAARSSPPGSTRPQSQYTRKSGTSMASPYVAGSVACIYQSSPKPVPIAVLRNVLASTALPGPHDPTGSRGGAGYLDVVAAVERTAQAGWSARMPPAHGPATRALPQPREAEWTGVTQTTAVAGAQLLFDPAALFDALVYGERSAFGDRINGMYEIVAEPGAIVNGTLDPGDLVVWRGLGEGSLGIARPVFESTPIVGRGATLGRDRIIVRPRSAELLAETAPMIDTCRPGEGPPGPEPDPSGKGPHPTVKRGTSPTFSRRPTVGHAQTCLNEWLARHIDGSHRCPASSSEASGYVERAIATLRANAQLPLAVDCRFGPNTQTATKAFQACMSLSRDGIIGPITWPSLEAFAPRREPPRREPPVDDAVVRWRTLLGPHCRDGNDVVELVDGPATFRSMADAIRSATGESHYVYLLGWWLDLDEPLDVPTSGTPCPPSPRRGPSTIRNLFTAASQRGVQVRAMLWDHTGGSKNTAEVAFIDGLPNGAALLDNHQLAFFQGSQHQKVLVVKGESGLVVFCGGIDINCDRVCPSGICPPSGTSGSASGSNQGQPLHDVHCRIAGPAAHDLLQVFIKRWFSNPRHVARDTAKGPLRGLTEPIPPPAGPAVVRIGETYNATATMPGGAVTTFRDRTVQDILLKVIAGARRFIYIEEQYLVSMCAAEAIRRALPNVDHVTILIAPSEISDMPQRWRRRKEFIDHIRTSPHRAKLRVFTLCDPAGQTPATRFGPHSYVHAKALIADDEIAVIGSANINRRGWEHDAEVVAAIVGAGQDGAPLARTLRTRLWSEHLGLPLAAVADPIASKGQWTSAPSRHVCPYNPTADTDSFFDSLLSIDDIDPPMPLATAPCCAIHGPSCPSGTPPAPSRGAPAGIPVRTR